MKILNFMKIENIVDPKLVDQMAYNLYLNENTGSQLIFQKPICERARLVLESISIEFLSLWKKLGKIIDKTDIEFIKASGGVSNSDYLLQCISTICQIEIRRMKNIESTSVGTMLLTRITHGHNIDLWSFDVEKVFLPQSVEHKDIILSRNSKL
uniref:Glycerol kinase (Trinotate prediction) n=1 Tax=Myxobolus squamalis TaxID=59785 RepID=A0A6B2FYM0_MYXSQ